ncbi:tyrosine-type recombinase/integrase [Corynebacterium halotolerans]|uniref:Integrase/recombinase n=1 Tax=Corynebacterium halotolerans YIM 70093 = DSM 44683 TaxID=1121362 RepID=M1MZD0_9CORY|nr:tyrosine-type recombinase/integrase [Corynebacterium halotolerans]AGF71134.1 integrase/recombinase [Corynebacterium halotolerans YIM 70093 = DSM 44683]AGF73044.1 integrase/recombinase [Corynebacterium halotolerans YIM 70093 = DSM 44683]
MKRDPATDQANVWVFARDFLHAYLPNVRGLSVKTIEAYRISLECFLVFLTDHEHVERAHVTFDHFDRSHLKAWLTWMNTDRGYAPRTITLRLSAIKAFLSYAAAEDLTLIAVHQAAQTLKTPPTAKAPIEYLTDDETRAVLAAHTGKTSKSRRNRMLLILLYDTAARVGEITALTLQNLSLTTPGHVTLTGKRNKTRVVPLSEKTIEHLHVYLAEFHPNPAQLPATRPLFYSLHHGQPTRLSTDTVSAVLKKAAESARDHCPSVPTNIHCHMLRKTKAMDLYQQGIPLPIIMRLLGHENASTTQAFYAFATLDMMRDAITAATPTTDAPARLTEDTLTALYSLR